MVGKRSSKSSSTVASSQQWSTSCSIIVAVMARDDLVPGQELVDEALAVVVAEQGAVAPQRLGQERLAASSGGAGRSGGTG